MTVKVCVGGGKVERRREGREEEEREGEDIRGAADPTLGHV